MAASRFDLSCANNVGCLRPFPSGTAHPYPAVGKGVRSNPLEFPELTFRFLSGNSVPFLDLTDELIALAFNDLPVVVGQTTPLLLSLSYELRPVSLQLIAIHGIQSPFD